MTAEQQAAEQQAATLAPIGPGAAAAQKPGRQQQGEHCEQGATESDGERGAFGQLAEHAGEAEHQRAEVDSQQGVATSHERWTGAGRSKGENMPLMSIMEPLWRT